MVILHGYITSKKMGTIICKIYIHNRVYYIFYRVYDKIYIHNHIYFVKKYIYFFTEIYEIYKLYVVLT